MRRNVKILVALVILPLLILTVITHHRLHASSAIPSKQPGNALPHNFPHAKDHVLVKLVTHSEDYGPPAGYEHIFGSWYRAPLQSYEDVQMAIDRLSTSAQFISVQPDYQLGIEPRQAQGNYPTQDESVPGQLTLMPNDPLYPRQWHFPPIQAPAAWEVARGVGVTVAVIDSGVSRGSDLTCHTFVHEYNAITDQSGPGTADDDYGHGTHVAGTVAQCTNNGLGVAGVAFAATLMPVKVLDSNGNGYSSDIASGINWATAHGADVINLSLAGPCNGQTWPTCSFPIVNDAITAAAAEDIFIAAAAGNWGDSSVGTPANHPDTVAVAAVDYNLERAHYSNRGTALSVSAPGGDLTQDENNDGQKDGVLQQSRYSGLWAYYYVDGTSMASPHVAGAATLLRSLFPLATRHEIQSVLESTALDLGNPGKDTDYGYGLVQIANAISALAYYYPTPTVTPTLTPTPSPTPILSAKNWLPMLWQSYQPPVPTPLPTPTPLLPTCVDQVHNGGFEENSAWVFPYTPNRAHYTWNIVHSGQRSVELGIQSGVANRAEQTASGDTNDASGELSPSDEGIHTIAYQSLSIPIDVDTATLTFWHWLGTEDDAGDWQRLSVISAADYQVIAEPMRELANHRQWRQKVFDMTPYQGQDILLFLNAFNDDDDQKTWMFIDEVSLQTCTVNAGF